MLKSRRVQIPGDTNELNLSYQTFDDEEEELEAIHVKEPSKLSRLILNGLKAGPQNSQKLFKLLEHYNFEILCSNLTQISNLATHIAERTPWSRLKLIHLNRNSLRDEDIVKIAQNSTWQELRTIRLSKNLIGNEGAIALGKNETWKNLRVLDLAYNQIEYKGAIGLAENSTWSELTELDLQHNLLDDESALVLGRNRAWKRLANLLVVKGNSNVTPTKKILFGLNSRVSNEFNQELKEREEKDIESLVNEKEIQFKTYFEQVFTTCRDERRVELERFWDNREKVGRVSFSDNGIIDIVRDSHLMWFPKLESLKLAGFQIGREEAELLCKAVSWINLQKVDLARSRLGDNEISIIAKNTTWPNLRSLNLSVNTINDEGCLSLSQNSSWKLLQSLNLQENRITDKGASYFSQNSSWTQIKEIVFNTNNFTQMNGVNSIVNNKNWQQLQRVYLLNNPISNDELIKLIEEHDTFTLPQIQIEVKKYLHFLNTPANYLDLKNMMTLKR